MGTKDERVSAETSSERAAKVSLYGAAGFAQSYFRRTVQSATGQLILEEEQAILRRLLPPGDGQLAVDVGAGNGRLLSLLRAVGYQPLGIDLSLSMLVADAALKEVRLLGDARRLPFADGSVSGVLAHRLLYHFEHYDELLAEFSRVVAPGGWICADILRWTPSSVARRIGLRSGRLVRPIDEAGLRRVAGQLGLEVAGRRGAFALNPATASMLPAGVARYVACANSLPLVPRVKAYVLLRKPAGAANPVPAAGALTGSSVS
ncbi:MAG: class I SAM-dependent methyltransferase [Chloroflexota bacterium]